MKRSLLHRFAAIMLVSSIFFSAASLVHAETFTMPQDLSYAGLTFSDPLTYNNQLPVPKPTTSIEFSQKKSLALAKETIDENHSKALENIVVSPTETNQEQEQSIPVTMPTPTIYVRTTPEITDAPTKPNTPIKEKTTQIVPTPSLTPPPPAPHSTVGGLNPDTLFSMVNAYRQSQGLQAFQKDDKTCNLAASRAPEVNGEIAAGTMHSGLKARNLPYWNTENIISMNSEQAAFNWWINDSIHHAAIVSTATYSCVACSGNACAEEFTNYQPK